MYKLGTVTGLQLTRLKTLKQMFQKWKLNFNSNTQEQLMNFVRMLLKYIFVFIW